MPANQQKTALQTPSSPRSSSTSRYTNKDGSKFITVPKGSISDSSLPSTPTAAPKPGNPSASPAPATGDVSTPAVNRKKQKRRQKAAAKAAAEQAANGRHSPSSGSGNQASFEYEIVPSDEDDIDYVLAEDIPPIASINGNGFTLDTKGKKKNKKKKKNPSGNATADGPPPQAQAQVAGPARGSGMSRDKIWSTSNHEERERIKEFWLGLGEEERKGLVKVEKDAVLKKMKEQQKHTCSCTVCGRKRTAIEEELEGLYDAYYLELEQFANQGEGPPILPPREFPLRPPRGLSSGYARQPPSRGRIVEHVGEDDEEELEDVYSEDEVEDDDYSDDEPPEDLHGPHERDVADFLTFGNSLQVKGGILTVADDLLKNDGKRFIEMMEQLAERRMAREEDAREHFSRGYGHPNGSYSNPHTHPPPEEDEYEEEEDEEEDYEDSQDEEYEEDEEDQMTEEQRMEEGRRMFQIFAARMFEQRVLTAYKEKVAKERQDQLLEEIEAENHHNKEQIAKKAKTAQKRREKTAQKKQALAEEKARKEAEKQAEEDARKEAELKHRAEQKMKSEARRKEKEAQKKAEEDARLKKEAERQRRLHEQKEKQAEQERKVREAKEREKKLKEEQRLKENRAREQREREAQERREKQERDKQEKEARAAAQAAKAAQQAAEASKKAKEEKERADKAAQKALTQQASSQPQSIHQPPTKRGQQHPPPLPAALPQQHAANPTNFVSPKIPVATPAIPKAPTPIRPRTTSLHQETGQTNPSPSNAGPTPRQSTSPHSSAQSFASPGPVAQERKVSGGFATMPPTSLSLTPPRAPSKGPTSTTPFPAPPISMQPPPGLAPPPHHPPLQPPPPPGFPSRMNLETIYPLGFRPSPSPNMMPAPPPGISAPPGRGFPPVTMPPPGFSHLAVSSGDSYSMSQGFPLSKDGPLPSHRRQSSIGFDSILPGSLTQPITRPAPIGRPNVLAAGKPSDGLDDAKHLGSRALLEDDDDLSRLPETSSANLRSQSIGARSSFAPSPFMDPSFPLNHNPWGPTSAGASQLFPPPGFGNAGWGLPMSSLGFHVGSPGSGVGGIRASAQPRHVYLRQLLCQACKDLNFSSADSDGYVDLTAVKSHIDALSGDSSITEEDLLNLCDTEGSHTNGGGTFDVMRDHPGPGKHSIRWVPEPKDGLNPHFRAVGAPGEIGSPLVGQATLRGI